MNLNKQTVAVVGLGYVGLPLALAFGRKINTIGFDLSKTKIDAYNKSFDPTGEMLDKNFNASTKINFSLNPQDIKQADFVIIAVPTPIDKAKKPDLKPVEGASKTVGANLKKGAIVIYESTVYPGVTEEVAVPILEDVSGLKCGQDFFVGYSPERINPGDKVHTLETITKIVSGQNPEVLEKVASLYELIIEAGVHKASSIKVAEAAKVIENTQRDLNIALMNELAIIFDKLNIDTLSVLKAAGTKWNFLPFRPGLVGGHCIGVDPYYLTHKAEAVGYNPQVILAGRRINDGMGEYIAAKAIKGMIQNGSKIKNAKILIIGLTFKEDCADLRNSRVIDVISELQEYGAEVLVYDPIADANEAKLEYEVNLSRWEELQNIEAIIAAVSHKQCLDISETEMAKISVQGAPFIDVKSAFNLPALQQAGFNTWRL